MSFLELLVGRRLSSDDQEHQQIGPAAGIRVLGLRAFSSSPCWPGPCSSPSAASRTTKPLVDFVLGIRDENPACDIVVVVPDPVMPHWYHALLDSNRGAVLRALLRPRGGPRVIVVATPFHLHD
jgi:hypothetical protein